MKERYRVINSALDGPVLGVGGGSDLQVPDLQNILVSRNRNPEPPSTGMST